MNVLRERTFSSNLPPRTHDGGDIDLIVQVSAQFTFLQAETLHRRFDTVYRMRMI